MYVEILNVHKFLIDHYSVDPPVINGNRMSLHCKERHKTLKHSGMGHLREKELLPIKRTSYSF